MIRVAVLSHRWYKDWPYLQSQLNRLASLYHEVVIIHAGETVRYGQFLTQWCKDHDEFTEIICERDVFTYGYGPANIEQAKDMMEAGPDEVWKFETSKGSMRRPDHAIFPEFWYLAAINGVPLRVFRAQFRKSKYTGLPYEEAQLDANGFPEAILARSWDAERNGLSGQRRGLQRYSNNPAAKRSRERRRKYRDPQ